jgi:hypothetical protein
MPIDNPTAPIDCQPLLKNRFSPFHSIYFISWRIDVNVEGLTSEQKKDLQEILLGVQQTVKSVAHMNTIGMNTDLFENFKFMINNVVEERAAESA